MTGGIIMAGVSDDDWRAPHGWPKRRPGETRSEYVNRMERERGNGDRDGLLVPPPVGERRPLKLPTGQPKAPMQPRAGGGRGGGGPLAVAILGYGVTKKLIEIGSQGTASVLPPPKYRPPEDFKNRRLYDHYQRERKRQITRWNSKIAPPKVGCKEPTDYEPPEPERKSAFEPRHRGQLGQDDPQSYLTNGARPGEPAKQYHYYEPPEPEFDPPEDEEEDPVDCNPRVQTGPGREMSP